MSIEDVTEFRRRASLPMELILSCVPGETIMDKAKRLGVSRQTLYGWLNGATPNRKLAAKLMRTTGLSADDIRRWRKWRVSERGV